MPTWDTTHGTRRGSYLQAGPNQLYVRQDSHGWSWFVDGYRGGVTGSEVSARAAAEAAVRGMLRTHTGRMAASAHEPRSAARAR